MGRLSCLIARVRAKRLARGSDENCMRCGVTQVDDVLYKVDGTNVSGMELDQVRGQPYLRASELAAARPAGSGLIQPWRCISEKCLCVIASTT